MGSPYSMTSWIIVFMMFGFVTSDDLSKDRDECANQLIGLATCLPYVGGTAKTPTPDCCTGLKQVLAKSKKCLCVLVKDRDDPQLGLKINATLALGLPAKCNAAANVSACPSLLHLAPNSPEARVFEQFANATKGSAPTVIGNPAGSSNSAPNAKQTNGGSIKKCWLKVDMVVAIVLWGFTLFLFSGVTGV
ncbi:hypothetical protein IFM89_016607 [Coptis chinensis]|uniref:Bifunctional inhibitor/plant lipid transfer protein/seed storage helical domain-containing protein n=1 Tax=Coptis chinensis TaxID=261450 RepID=A0A835M657_9MAGN|nr:hypothetical protein IFM89_016607 [Coptis chinensis]